MSEEIITVDCTADQMAAIARAARVCQMSPERFMLQAAVNCAELVSEYHPRRPKAS